MAPPARALLWGLLVLASAALSRAAWRAEARPDPPPAPPALPRPASAAERTVVLALQDRLQAELTAAAATHGSPLAAGQLEDTDADGRPLLPSGLPDNPLRPGVSGVLARCPPVEQPGDEVDWLYCPEDATVVAVGLTPAG